MASVAVATATSSSPTVTMNAGNVATANNTAVSKTMETTELAAAQPQTHSQYVSQNQQREEARTAEVDSPFGGIRSETPLSGDLRKILTEVARTGACPWLAWDHDSKDHAAFSESLNPVASFALTSNILKSTSLSRPPFSTHRRSKSSPYAAAVAQGPARKKHRNGLHKTTRRRFAAVDSAAGRSSSSGGRKRPLFLIRTHPNTTANASAYAAPGSVGSGRTSGSEPDDSTQYECDSEGTSATTNSEVSVERLRKSQQRVNPNSIQSGPNKSGGSTFLGDDLAASQSYKTLQEAFRVALGTVLDHFYKRCGGYKLSPAEKRRNETLAASVKSEERRIPPLSPEGVFQQRRRRLLTMLLPESAHSSEGKLRGRKCLRSNDGPPFTIQRIAEVLVSPQRYYTQTHKLCNCLEKLLLVKSSTAAFGGSTGGDTSQSRREEREMAALADEKGRQESELRERRLRWRTTSPSDEVMADATNDAAVGSGGSSSKDEASNKKKQISPENEVDRNEGRAHPNSPNSCSGTETSNREMLEAAARASLRTKFDHVGIDPHSSPDRDVRSIAENRGMTNSPPPPSLAMSAAPSNIALPGHSGVAGFVRQHLPEQNSDHHTLGRVPSPILFSPGSDPPMHANPNMHMLQLHHAVALAGVSLGRGAPSPLDLMTIDAGNSGVSRSQHLAGTESADFEVEHGRSSASNSDVDSESDDVSLDDSASDRSDGSDSGSVTHYEPFTAARAMALNRMLQQQRLQSRITSLSSFHQSEGFRPPADSEYQSGDSIDSMRAEDSGGSDSSSSDLAD